MLMDMEMNGSMAVSFANVTLTHHESLASRTIKTFAYCLLFLVSLVGNVFIIHVIRKDKRLRTTVNILVSNMAVSDLLVAIFSVPRRVLSVQFDTQSRWYLEDDFGLALCKLMPFLKDISIGVSVYSCIFIAIDRYSAVAQPLKGGFFRSRLKYILTGIWVFSIIIHSPYFYMYRLRQKGDVFVCVPDWSQAGVPHMFAYRIYMFSLFSMILGLPLPIVTILYLLIVYKLRQAKVPGQSVDSAIMRRRAQQNKKVLKMSVVIVSFLFVSWLLFSVFIFMFLLGTLGSLPSYINAKDFAFAAVFIAESSCCYNFFIYLTFNGIYRQNFLRIMRCAEQRNANSNQSGNGERVAMYTEGSRS